MIIDNNIKQEDLKEKLDLFWKLSGAKILKIESEYNTINGAPVFTVERKIFNARLDRVDTGISIWIGHFAV